jgi:K+-sensing histidine kinase KdpD
MSHSGPMSPAEQYLRTGFLERLGHELKGPIGVTLGVLDELELSLANDPARALQLVAMARRSSRRLLALAERLQHTAQLESGSTQWRMEQAVPKQLIERALVRARDIDARRGVKVEALDDGDVGIVDVDVSWLVLALSELFLNALRNARSRVTVSARRSDDRVEVSVVDDGPGFSGPVPPRFVPASRPQGLGLSLCLVEAVVSAHGGNLAIGDDSQPGGRVTLSLPAAAYAASQP